MNHPAIIIGAAIAGLYLYSKQTQSAGGGASSGGGTSSSGGGGVAVAPAPAPIALPPAPAPTITDAIIREWLQTHQALDGTVDYRHRIALVQQAMAQYGVSRDRIALAMGVSRQQVDNYLDGRLDYFKAG